MSQEYPIIDYIVDDLSKGIIETGNNYTNGLRRIATWYMKLVNYAYQDSETKKTVALLFRNDYDDNDTMLENAIKTLKDFDSLVCAFDLKSLNEANIFSEAIKSNHLERLSIGIVVYDVNNKISILQSYTLSRNVALKRTVKEQKSYWCWWRDGSQYEVADLLELSFKYDGEDGDIYSTRVYPEFFNMMISGKTKKWDGSARQKNYSPSSYKAEKQNYKIPMCQLGLWEVDTGHITDKGLTLLDVIRTYGADSNEYFDCLAKIILLDGKHLDLIKDLETFQKTKPEIIPESSTEFFILFDEFMMDKNSIGTRKPSAIKTGAKKAYVRDEPKLWNKLGIIRAQSPSRYYKPFKGIEFNWERINKILLSDVLGGYDE